MPRDESKDLMEQDKEENDARREDFLFHINQAETENPKFEAKNVYNGCMVKEESPLLERKQDENITCGNNRQIVTSNDIENDTLMIPMFPNEKTSKLLHLPWDERKSMKIRYTRQYLLDRRYDPLSAAFPDCLFKFLQSKEIPLREPENCHDYRSMDHILFYTSLPYTRMRNSLTSEMKRTPFKLCY